MFHLRLLVPPALTAAVCQALAENPGVAHVVLVRGAAVRPAGDLVEADVVREVTDELVDELLGLGLDAGAVTGQDLALARSEQARVAERATPGESADSVVWQQVQERADDESVPSGTFLAFLSIAVLLAAIGVVLDSPITIVGAMVVGPEFGPLAAISIGLVLRRWALVRRAALTLVLGFPAAVAVTALASWLATGVHLIAPVDLDISHQTDFIYRIGPFSFIVALLAGAAGMLSMTTGKSAALVGVFISVTTVPAAGYVAVGSVLHHWGPVGGAALQLAINLVGIVAAAVATLLVVRWVDVRRHRRLQERAVRR
ncbi:DUF389 domain-containing protein [Nakamurella endophytica]|uniref:DUF389 domain-containing protein n=1 Tax=Nakamurella endophytica TaxID=1748367 RepID=A0A917T9B9_9ACTN|nr:DUF389 domain-containing protein [Nakamurella endophytica]GGM14224.1 hypothetical protein GCM10011594_37820 [Nakamurella endophytica]